jgi:hypothetical protein
MQLGNFENFMLIVGACAGVGKFLDFWIGKAGQQRLKDRLETWWLRVSYVRWDNLGREEALFSPSG